LQNNAETLVYPHNRLCEITCFIWDSIQDPDQWKTKQDQEFEKFVEHLLRNRKYCGLMEVRRRQQRQGLSRVFHEFDVVSRIIPEVKDAYRGKHAGLIFECKTFSVDNLLNSLKAGKMRPPLLDKEELETFIFECYDVFLERDMLPGMELDDIFLFMVSTKPPTREAFLISEIYGVVLIYPQLNAFKDLLNQGLNAKATKEFINILGNSSVFKAPLCELLKELSKHQVSKKEMRQLEKFLIRWTRRKAGSLPKRGQDQSYIVDNYKGFLNRLSIIKTECGGSRT